ncbi:MAG: glutathione S-transferase family protein [Myxacorys chilensis ATA2-1-KO14]|jgi:glutathione S-transferase|nr:glutathione S-transferase family protein [Myxacorys chilensis ATA2-1-KO14]
MYKLYDFALSGNCYKIRLLLTQLNLPFEKIAVNIVDQETHSPDFLQKNPNGKVPVLETESGVFLTESNAILTYLADGTAFFPRDRLEQTEILKWLFFEQSSLGANLSRPRFWISVAKQAEQFASLIAYHQRLGNAALKVMNEHLTQHPFLVGERYTIADIANYAYTHVANQGGYDMSQYPAIAHWCDRVSSQPNYISIHP